MEKKILWSRNALPWGKAAEKLFSVLFFDNKTSVLYNIDKKGGIMSRIIFHIDVNNAFLSWTAVYLLKKGYKKDIRKIPSVIGGWKAKKRDSAC